MKNSFLGKKGCECRSDLSRRGYFCRFSPYTELFFIFFLILLNFLFSDSDTTDLVDGETHTIISNRIIMAIMTQENFSADTVGSATADIKWDIVTAPEG